MRPSGRRSQHASAPGSIKATALSGDGRSALHAMVPKMLLPLLLLFVVASALGSDVDGAGRQPVSYRNFQLWSVKPATRYQRETLLKIQESYGQLVSLPPLPPTPIRIAFSTTKKNILSKSYHSNLEVSKYQRKTLLKIQERSSVGITFRYPVPPTPIRIVCFFQKFILSVFFLKSRNCFLPY